jgi:hypothetical protein
MAISKFPKSTTTFLSLSIAPTKPMVYSTTTLEISPKLATNFSQASIIATSSTNQYSLAS